MADEKISAMTVADALTGAELIAAVQSGGNVSLTPAQVLQLCQILGLTVGYGAGVAPALKVVKTNETVPPEVVECAIQIENPVVYGHTGISFTFEETPVCAMRADGAGNQVWSGLGDSYFGYNDLGSYGICRFGGWFFEVDPNTPALFIDSQQGYDGSVDLTTVTTLVFKHGILISAY